MRRAHRVGHGVIDVGFVRGPITTRPPTGQIPPPNELPRRGGRPIPRIRCHPGRNGQRLERGGLRHLTYRLGGQDAEPGQIAGLVAGCPRGWPVRRARESPPRRPRAPKQPGRRRDHTGRPNWLRRGPAGRRHRRGAAPRCADRAHTRWRPTHPGAARARRRRRHGYRPTTNAIPAQVPGSI